MHESILTRELVIVDIVTSPVPIIEDALTIECIYRSMLAEYDTLRTLINWELRGQVIWGWEVLKQYISVKIVDVWIGSPDHTFGN